MSDSGRIQEHSCDEVFPGVDYRVLDSDFLADIETIHAHPDRAAFTTSMAVVENTRLDGELLQRGGSLVRLSDDLQSPWSGTHLRQ